ncbi:hypothetical protein DL93DRAFT_2086741 [Clavulina sp. PMI_390]|nr:hypothetical protein DL93DRAFT_2086741 [Clavulina sp. PMI_390]
MTRLGQLVYDPIRKLDAQLHHPLPPQILEDLRQDVSQSSPGSFVLRIARTQLLRGLVRLLPSGPVIALSNVAQMVDLILRVL